MKIRKNILLLICSFVLLCMLSSAAYAYNADVTVETPGIELNFHDKDVKAVKYKINNHDTDSRIVGTMRFAMTDENNNTIWQGTQAVTVPAGRELTNTVQADFSKYGLHTMTLTLEADDTVIASAETRIALSKQVKDDKVERLGVSAHFGYNREAYSKTLPLLADMGAKYVRDEVLWGDYETSKGVYGLCENMKKVIKDMKAYGLEPLIILGKGNTLYTDKNDSYPKTTEQLTAFGNYVYELVSELKSYGVKYFEIWNEPNQSMSGSEYAKVVKTAYTRAKAANSDAVMIGPTSAGVSNSFIYSMKSQTADIGSCFDILSYHQYEKTAPETGDDSQIVIKCRNSLGNQFGYDKEVWLSEMGWSSDDIDNDERSAAMYAVRNVLNNDALKTVDKMFFYTWINSPGTSTALEQNYGLMLPSGTVKKGYIAYAAMNDIIGNATFQERSIDGKNYVYKYDFGGVEEIIAAYNVDDEKSSITITPKYENVRFYDMYGNLIEASENNGVFSVELDGAPIYIVSTKAALMDYSSNTASVYGTLRNLRCGEQMLLCVFNPGYDIENILDENAVAYIEQFSADKDGCYEFSFPMCGKEGNYKVYLGYANAGGITGPIEVNVKRGVNAEAYIMRGETKVDSIAGLSDVEGKISANVDIDDIYNTQLHAILYAGGYENNILKWIYTEDINQTSYGNNSISIELNSGDMSGIDKIELFVWTDDMKPIITQKHMVD